MWYRYSAVIFTLFWVCVVSQNCTTPRGKNSSCVPIIQCSEIRKVFEQKPIPISLVNFLRKSQCGYEGNIPKVCCGPPPALNRTESPKNESASANITTPRPSSDDQIFPEDSFLAPRKECGIDTAGNKIFSGTTTELDEFPWMALLGHRSSNGTMKFQCGGALINRRYVLTAAHCIKGRIQEKLGTLTTVRLGEHDVRTPKDCQDNVCAELQEIPVGFAYTHAGFTDDKTVQHDIGIIRLAKRATYSYYVQPICLVESSAQMPAVGDDLHIAGWGKTLKGPNSPVKLKLMLPFYDKSKCDEKYKTIRNNLGPHQICAGGVFKEDACVGDSGGPLMKRLPEGVWESVGIISTGYGCGRDGWPSIYTSVPGYIDWIKETLESSNQ